jgi:putative flippase GtrA
MSASKRWLRHWAARSLGAGAISTLVDLAALVVLVQAFGVRPVPAAVAGATLGSLAGFALNKYVAFRDAASPVWPQLARYLGTFGLSLAVHAGIMYLCVERLGVNYLLAKLAADFLVFTCGGLAAMRLFVFRLGEEPGA